MKLPIKTYEVDHEVVIINLFEDADGKTIHADDIAIAVNSLASERDAANERAAASDDEMQKQAKLAVDWMLAERAAVTRAEKAEASVSELIKLVGSKHKELVDEEERAEKAEARLRELETPKEAHVAPAPAEDEQYLHHLYNADPDCKHKVVPASGGGVQCTKCSGWFCY